MYLSIETFIFDRTNRYRNQKNGLLSTVFLLIQWVEPYVHHSKMVLIDDTLHHINTVMGNQFIVFFYFYVCGGEPNGSTKLLSFENSSR
jgi:hypothetical protein